MSANEFWTDGQIEHVSGRRGREEESRPQRLRHNAFAKRKRPTGLNGIHRRRNKRSAW